MQNLVKGFLSLPIGGRGAVLIGILLLLWIILGRLVLKIFSILPWFLKKFFLAMYTIIEIPVSALHKKFGSIFGNIDQGLTSTAEKVYDLMEIIYLKTHEPNKIYVGRAFLVCLILIAYLLIPIAANLKEKPFTFWQQSYVEKETAVVRWMEDRGWLE